MPWEGLWGAVEGHAEHGGIGMPCLACCSPIPASGEQGGQYHGGIHARLEAGKLNHVPPARVGATVQRANVRVGRR